MGKIPRDHRGTKTVCDMDGLQILMEDLDFSTQRAWEGSQIISPAQGNCTAAGLNLGNPSS